MNIRTRYAIACWTVIPFMTVVSVIRLRWRYPNRWFPFLWHRLKFSYSSEQLNYMIWELGRAGRRSSKESQR